MQTNWLEDRTILLTRPGETPSRLKRNIENAGGRVIHQPAMAIEIEANRDKVIQQSGDLQDVDALIFISRNAVRCACELVPDIVPLSTGKTIFAIGSGSREELLKAGFGGVISSSGNTGSEALLGLDEFREENLHNRKIMILRGHGGRELLGEQLLARGASIQYVELYKRVLPKIQPGKMSNLWRVEKPDVAMISSAEGLKNLLHLTAKEDRNLFLRTPLIVISPRLEKIAESLGFTAAIKVAMGYSDDDFMAALKEMIEATTDE